MEVVVEDEEEVKANAKLAKGLQQSRRAFNRTIRNSMMTLLKTRMVKITELANTLAEPHEVEGKNFSII